MLRIAVLTLCVIAGAAAAQTDRPVSGRSGEQTAPPPQLQIYMMIGSQQVGPLDADGYKERLGNPEAASSTLVWMPGLEQWQLASTIPQLQGIIASIGQEDAPPDEFRVADVQSYILGVWISSAYPLSGDNELYSIIQMKVLTDGRFEGASVVYDRADQSRPPSIFHEKGTWTATPDENGAFVLERKTTFARVAFAEITRTGTYDERFVLKANGPDLIETSDGIRFVRVPEVN